MVLWLKDVDESSQIKGFPWFFSLSTQIANYSVDLNNMARGACALTYLKQERLLHHASDALLPSARAEVLSSTAVAIKDLKLPWSR